VLTPKQTHDVQGLGTLFRMPAGRIEALPADKGYVADAIRSQTAAAGVEAAIPTKSNRRIPTPPYCEIHHWQNFIECIFGNGNKMLHISTR
jgi:hypothetical protein